MTITVRQAGIQTTVQDLGRPGWQHVGVPVGGAMDQVAHRIANLLVGNPDDAAGLECTLGGVALQFMAPALVAFAGRDVTASLDGVAIPAWQPFRVEGGALLVVHTGCRTCIAIAGGIDVPTVLDARGTSLRAGFGGFHGRALRRDDILPLGAPSSLGKRMFSRLVTQGRMIADWGAGPGLRPSYAMCPTVRIIEGPALRGLTDASRERVLHGSFRIAPESDRMGFRLQGHTLELTAPLEMLSAGVTIGTIQLPPGGTPIVLMADRQTTGGYPRLGEVIAYDLPLLAQLRPGDEVRFELVALDVAHTLYRQREHDIARARHAVQLRCAATDRDAR